MSSIKSIGHPSNWLTTENAKENDVIEGILLGGKETKTRNTMNGRDHTPARMVAKLSMLAQNTTVPGVKSKAREAIKLLEPLQQDSPLNETDRKRIFNQVNSL